MKFIKDWVFSCLKGKRGIGEQPFARGCGMNRIKAPVNAAPIKNLDQAWVSWRSRIEEGMITAITFSLRFTVSICLILAISHQAVSSQPQDTSNLPPPKAHALPQSLATWKNKQGDYFKQIKSTPLGYLVWSQFPLKIYVDSVTPSNTAANQRFQQWTTTARRAIAEWNVYLPLEEVSARNTADILILRSQPERSVKLNPDTGLYDIPRAVAAQTNYKFYLTENPATISMRMTMQVSPSFTEVPLLATIRHELGHALGIWGHSPETEDALYFSQVSNPPSISARDVNTLKKIYQQSTRLGWKI